MPPADVEMFPVALSDASASVPATAALAAEMPVRFDADPISVRLSLIVTAASMNTGLLSDVVPTP